MLFTRFEMGNSVSNSSDRSRQTHTNQTHTHNHTHSDSDSDTTQFIHQQRASNNDMERSESDQTARLSHSPAIQNTQPSPNSVQSNVRRSNRSTTRQHFFWWAPSIAADERTTTSQMTYSPSSLHVPETTQPNESTNTNQVNEEEPQNNGRSINSVNENTPLDIPVLQRQDRQNRSMSDNDEVDMNTVAYDQTQQVHWDVTCDVCLMSPITGIRWKCNECPDTDLCDSCHAQQNIPIGDHDPDRHTFTRIEIPRYAAPFAADNFVRLLYSAGHRNVRLIQLLDTEADYQQRLNEFLIEAFYAVQPHSGAPPVSEAGLKTLNAFEPSSSLLEENCVICLDQYVDNDVLSSVPKCNHIFHRACLCKWLRIHNSCPACRNAIEDCGDSEVNTCSQ